MTYEREAEDDYGMRMADGNFHEAVGVPEAPILDGQGLDERAGLGGTATPLHLECCAENF